MTKRTRTETATVQTGFTIHASDASSVVATFGDDGWFHLEQDGNVVLIAPQAFYRFKNAVAQLKEV